MRSTAATLRAKRSKGVGLIVTVTADGEKLLRENSRMR
jgi:hypothetical protein